MAHVPLLSPFLLHPAQLLLSMPKFLILSLRFFPFQDFLCVSLPLGLTPAFAMLHLLLIFFPSASHWFYFSFASFPGWSSTLKSHPVFPHPKAWAWERFQPAWLKNLTELWIHTVAVPFKISCRFWVDESQWYSTDLRKLTPVYTSWKSLVITYIIHWKQITEKTFEQPIRQTDSLKSHLWIYMCFTAVFF